MVYVWMIYEMVVPGMIFMVIFVMDLGLGGIEPMVNGRYMKNIVTSWDSMRLGGDLVGFNGIFLVYGWNGW